MIVAATTLVAMALFMLIAYLLFFNNDNSPTFNGSLVESSFEDDYSSEIETEVTTDNNSSEVEQTTAPQNTIIMPDLVNLNYDIQNNAQALKEWIEMIPTYSFNEQYPAVV